MQIHTHRDITNAGLVTRYFHPEGLVLSRF